MNFVKTEYTCLLHPQSRYFCKNRLYFRFVLQNANKVIDLIFKEETGVYNEIDLDEDAPTFQGYTFDYLDYVDEEELEAKTIAYIRQNKELFTN